MHNLSTYRPKAFEEFWKRYPALLYGIAMFLGTALAFNPTAYYILIPILLLALTSKSRIWLLFIVIVLSVEYVRWNTHFPKVEQKKIKGIASFQIDSLAESSTHFGKQFLYKGKIKSFSSIPDLKNLPITISMPIKKEIIRPLANKDYIIEGTLVQKEKGLYAFKAEAQKPWLSVQNSTCLAEKRFHFKKKVIHYIKSVISDSASGTFLAGIATGCFDDRHMSADFSRFGLQHIMAISGFHFSIIASFLSVILGLFFSKKKAIILTIFLLTTYFLFLGCSASILRAWIAILAALTATHFKRDSQALNSLGLGLIAVLAYDPLLYSNLGFQFSFLTTASILLFYSTVDKAIEKTFKKRVLDDTKRMNTLNQYGYLILTFFRQAAALTAAVNVTALPMTLFYFGEYPLLGMVYNIFFPFLVSASMLLLMLGMSLPFIPFIHSMNSTYTKFLLGFTDSLPRNLDLKIYANISLSFLVIYLSLLFFISIFFLYDEKRT